MLNLILHTLFCISFGLVVKHAQHRGLRLLPVGAVNYLLAAAVTGCWALFADRPELRTPVLGTGVFAGVVYVVAFLFLAVLCWKEVVSRKGRWGIAVASAAVVFLNLK